MKRVSPRVAAIHDLSGFGRVSLSMVIPILTTMGVQVCPLPTAVLSTHTGGYDNYKFIDLTEHLEEYIAHWASIGAEFDCIYSGYLGSPKQISIISGFINDFRKDEQLIVIDPVMGDNGKLYSSFDTTMVTEMKKFIGLADIITPNLTEAALLLDTAYQERVNDTLIKEWLTKLAAMGPKTVVITGVPGETPDMTCVLAYNSLDQRFWKVNCSYIPTHFPGTGDGFTSVLVGSLLRGDSLPIALDRSVQFILSAIRASYGYQYPHREGVLLERVLANLNLPVLISTSVAL
jgi:pyridoxine kinase